MLVPKYLKSLPAQFPAPCVILLVFQALLKYSQHSTTGESQMPKRDLHYFLGKEKNPAMSEKQETAPGLNQCTLAKISPLWELPQYVGTAENSLKMGMSLSCAPVSLSCPFKQFGNGCGRASPLLPSLPNFLSHLCIPAQIWLRSPCSVLSLTPNSHLMPRSTPISL